MEPYEIKYHLAKNNSSVSKIAKNLGITHVSVSQVVNGKGVSARVMKKIAETVGLPVSSVFPKVRHDKANNVTECNPVSNFCKRSVS